MSTAVGARHTQTPVSTRCVTSVCRGSHITRVLLLAVYTMYQPHLANIKFGDGFQLFGAVERVRGGVRNTAVEW